MLINISCSLPQGKHNLDDVEKKKNYQKGIAAPRTLILHDSDRQIRYKMDVVQLGCQGENLISVISSTGLV